MVFDPFRAHLAPFKDLLDSLKASCNWLMRSFNEHELEVSEDAVDFVKCLLVRDPVQRMDVGGHVKAKSMPYPW